MRRPARVDPSDESRQRIGALSRAFFQTLKPPPKLRVSEFADRSVIVTSGPLAGTHWRTDFAPFQRGVMDAFHEPGVEIVAVMGSSQWGKTSTAVNVVAYHMKHDPCTILVVEPTVDPMAKDFARNRLDPVIAASPDLSEVVPKKRSRDAANSTLQKTFRGGSLAIGGANSAASLAARSVRLLVCDEVDRYPPELPGEGNTLAIAFKRTTAYRRRRRILLLSSPTLKGSPIHTWFGRGDQRRYHVPCPSCECMHPYEWSNVRWENSDPSTAHLHCPACDHAFSDGERIAVLARGEWRPDQPARLDKTVVSFHLWEAYSPLSSLSEIVTGFLRARKAQKAGDKSEMHTWQNTTLGEPVEPDSGEGVEPNALLARRKPFAAQVPLAACCITLGVDVQDDRLEGLVFGWAPEEESWLVDRFIFPGDPSEPDVWRQLDAHIDRGYMHESGTRLPVHAVCIDSAGHRTAMVYDYAWRHGARRVYATIGRDGQRPIVNMKPSMQDIGHGREVPLYTVGVDAAKSVIVGRLKLTEAGPGYIHLPAVDWCDDELAEQLTSETLVTLFEKGIRRQVWRKRRPRNEALDCAVLALAALRRLFPDPTVELRELREYAAALATSPQPTQPPQARPAGRRVSQSPYLQR
jgi:phage terminase large subunit GpA-like protein